MTAQTFSRRQSLQLAATGVGLIAAPGLVFAKAPDTVPVEELAKPGILKDVTIGSPDAKIRCIEYASMTCPHCARFHKNVFPQLKTKYVDTGKIQFTFREFPLDTLAAAGSMLARCAGDGKTMSMISVLFERQEIWAVNGPAALPNLFEIAKQAGFTKETFDACLSDQKLLDDIAAGRTRASEAFGVDSTPTFFVDGKLLQSKSEPTIADFDKLIEPLLKS